MMHPANLKTGNLLLQSHADGRILKRTVDRIIGSFVHFEDGYGVASFDSIQSPEWLLLEEIRDPIRAKSPIIGDKVRFRDKLCTVKSLGTEFTYLHEGDNYRTSLIQKDKEGHWYVFEPEMIQAGDIVRYGTQSLKVRQLIGMSQDIVFWCGRFCELKDIETVGETFKIKVGTHTGWYDKPKAGNFVSHEDKSLKVAVSKGNTITFQCGKTIDVEKIVASESGGWKIEDGHFFDPKEPKDGKYWMVFGKTPDELTHNVNYASSKYWKLWGSPFVQGIHLCQSMRK